MIEYIATTAEKLQGGKVRESMSPCRSVRRPSLLRWEESRLGGSKFPLARLICALERSLAVTVKWG